MEASGFGVTYEGLKLARVRFNQNLDFWGFGVTYEGLKRVIPTINEKYYFGFGVTYEGLKPE